MKFYRKFLDGVPHYLARYYWWAYLWRPSVWFFDHQPIINLILFGHYRILVNKTIGLFSSVNKGEVLQLSCVYGNLTPALVDKVSHSTFNIADVAQIQLDNVKKKIGNNSRFLITRMNSEKLGYRNDIFSTVIVFFLLHELPPEARRNTLRECMRVLSIDGVLLITDYDNSGKENTLTRFSLSRKILTHLEPFLSSFWSVDLVELLNDIGKPIGKGIELISKETHFSNLYQVSAFRVVEVHTKSGT